MQELLNDWKICPLVKVERYPPEKREGRGVMIIIYSYLQW